MKTKNINVIKDFNSKPYGRYPDDGAGCGENFRKYLAGFLKEYDLVHVELTGYNRYGRSFIDEAFGGLIRVEGYTLSQLKKKLTYTDKDIKSIETLIDERLNKAESDAGRG